MKYYFIFILIPLITLSQVPSDKNKPSFATTKSWIIEKLDIYAPLMPSLILAGKTIRYPKQQIYKTKIIDCNLIIEERDKTPDSDSFSMIYTIPISEIYVPIFSHGHEEYKDLISINFSVKGAKPLIKIETIWSNSKGYTEYSHKTGLFLSSECEMDNIPNRFKKAFKDLIINCGGNVVDSAY